MNYTFETGFDDEIKVNGLLYYLTVDISADYNVNTEDVSGIELTKLIITDGDENPVSYSIVGKRNEEVEVEGNPDLAKAINTIIMETIDEYVGDEGYQMKRELLANPEYDEQDED